MKTYQINENTYELIKDYKNGFDYEAIKERYTEYFDDYDYIVGDFAYDKVRLEGYYDSSNKSVKNINDIKYLDDYINDYCSYGARIFVLKKLK